MILIVLITKFYGKNNKMMKSKSLYNLLLLIIFLISAVIISCDDTVTNTDIDNVTIPSKNVSYGKYIQPVFNLKCTSSGCHDDISAAGGYSLTTWSGAVIPGIVDPFSVETSRLVWRVEGIGVPIMPPIGSSNPPLTLNQVEGIKTWIREGAQNN